jgi:formylglycine-generating enzyme required for sulfatase activity
VNARAEQLQAEARSHHGRHDYAAALACLSELDGELSHLRDESFYGEVKSAHEKSTALLSQIDAGVRSGRGEELLPVIRAYLELVPESEKIGELQAALEKAAAEKAAAEGTAASNLQFRGVQATGRNVEITNAIGMKFRLIRPGRFLMGSPDREQDRSSDEHQHEVTLTRAFYLGVYPVTQAEWTSVMGSNPSHFQTRQTRQTLPSPWFSSEQIGNENVDFPVECVSWDAAQAFLGKLNASHGMSGVRYRLPSEAEWEYACRAGTTSPFSFGGVLQGDQANCDGNYPYGTRSTGPYLGRPSVVGSYGANGFGLSDMHGNVYEWCEDWYGEDYYSSSPSEDPAGPSSGFSRVLRGGSWRYGAYFCRSARRNFRVPAFSNRFLGFRVLCELS